MANERVMRPTTTRMTYVSWKCNGYDFPASCGEFSTPPVLAPELPQNWPAAISAESMLILYARLANGSVIDHSQATGEPESAWPLGLCGSDPCRFATSRIPCTCLPLPVKLAYLQSSACSSGACVKGGCFTQSMSRVLLPPGCQSSLCRLCRL